MRPAILMLALAGCSATLQPAEAPAPSRRATLLFFSDAHAQLEEHPELFWTPDGQSEVALAGGYARLAQVARDIRRQTEGRALLIDGGDTFQGSGPAAWSEGEAILAPQRALGVDLGIPGNWEVVYGPPRMQALVEAVGYPMIAANIVDEASGEPIFPATLVREVGGIRIGFVGLDRRRVEVAQAA